MVGRGPAHRSGPREYWLEYREINAVFHNGIAALATRIPVKIPHTNTALLRNDTHRIENLGSDCASNFERVVGLKLG